MAVTVPTPPQGSLHPPTVAARCSSTKRRWVIPLSFLLFALLLQGSSYRTTTATTPTVVDEAMINGQGTAELYPLGVVDRALEAVVASCRTDVKDQLQRCFVVRNAVMDRSGTIALPRQGNDGFIREFMMGKEEGGKRSAAVPSFPAVLSGYLMKPFPLRLMTPTEEASWLGNNPQRDGEALPTATVGYAQLPVIGSEYVNVWHTLAEQLFLMLHTVLPLVEAKVPVEWVTDSPWVVFKQACRSLASCRRSHLFRPFEWLFASVYFFREGFPDAAAPRRRFERLLLGIHIACSPVPPDGLADPRCGPVMSAFRRLLLGGAGLPISIAATPEEQRCPRTLVLSRQHLKYRKIYPFDETVAALKESFAGRGCDPHLVQVVAPNGTMPLREQLAMFVNNTVLLGVRGAATTFFPMLARGGGYLSISRWNDRWQPFRRLVPAWTAVHHVSAELVHHENPHRRPHRFLKHGTDPNRCGYRVQPKAVVTAFWELVEKLPRPPPGIDT